MKILVTGSAGFIGFHVSRALLQRGDEVVGVDNLNSYYDVRLKQDRLGLLNKLKHFQFERLDLANRDHLLGLMASARPEVVVNLAAQAGVRYSLQNPDAYLSSNIIGFGNVLEACRRDPVRHLVFASSSSVYGANTRMPFSVRDNVDHPLSIYAASKKANELMAHTYSHLFRIPATGLRFFTVYGPWGRPDMAMFIFTKAILEGRPIDVYNQGDMKRDFTYIDDVVEGVVRVIDKPAEPNSQWSGADPDPASSRAPYRLYNIGSHRPVELMKLIELLEHNLGRRAELNLLPMQPGDVPATFADISDLEEAVGFEPKTPIEEGVARFIDWYRSYYSARDEGTARYELAST